VLVVAAALGLTACDILVESLNAKATEEWRRTYPLAAGGRVEVRNTNGSIEVTAGEGTTVEVVAEKVAKGGSDQAAKELLPKIEIREDVSPERIRLETRVPSGLGMLAHGEVSYRLTIPRDAHLTLTTANGSVRATGASGPVTLETTNGSVQGNGLGGSVQAETTNGSVRIDADTLAADGIRVETVNGSIEVKIPATVKADVSARCVNGRVQATGLNLAREDEGERGRRRLEGRVNGGGPRIELTTTNGSVRLIGK
jgi:DUF4097 and DUF4098 domain-containing protein YvlB